MFCRRLPFLVLLIFFQVNTVFAMNGMQSARALEIQAAFLVKFSLYVKWPADAFLHDTDPIIIAIFGRDPFGSTIDKIARSFRARGREIEIRRYRDRDVLSQCHILYIPAAESGHIDEISNLLLDQPVLLVGNFPRFLEHSGIINFVSTGGKIRFDISRMNSDKARLEISSKLFAVALSIK